MKKKKYELLTDSTIELNSVTLYRIRALRKFRDVKKGDIGGYIQSEDNLSHFDNAWVYGDAQVYGTAHVFGKARVFDDARVYGDAQVFGAAQVRGDAWVYGNARVFGNSQVYGTAYVCGDAHVYDNAQVFDKARVFDNAWVYGNARVFGDSQVYGTANVCDDAKIKNRGDISVVVNIGSRSGSTTYAISSNLVFCGCYSGTLEKFEKRVEEVYGDSKFGKQYKAAILYFKSLREQ